MWKLCILRSSRLCISGWSGVRGRMVRDLAKRFEGISGLSSRIWCYMGSLVPRPSVIKNWTIRDRAEWSRVVPGRIDHIWRDLGSLRVDSCRVGWSGVIRRPVHAISGRSATYPDGPAGCTGRFVMGPNCSGLYPGGPVMYSAT